MRAELLQWGDGTIRLAFWDSESGNDQIFILDADGKVYRSGFEDDGTPLGTETRTLVDFVAELRKLAGAA